MPRKTPPPPTAIPTKPRAYSYVRFSTPEQARGDSFRRQMTAAREYAARHGLEMDETADFQDHGVSGYRGANATEGRLGDFLALVREGLVPPGSFLLVESLDRLSRQTARKALRTLEDIIDAGVNVVTLFDDKVYDRASLEGTDLLIALLFMIRAHEESLTKGRRVRAAWDRKRELASERRLTAKAPAWLRPTDTGFELIPEYAETIRRIFALALEGKGRHSIAATLNADRTPVFAWEQGRKRKAGAAAWYASYIGKILLSPAVVGTMVPHVEEHVGGRTVRTPLDPVEGYYPAVVDAETFASVQAMRLARRPSGGRAGKAPPKNPLGGLMVCPCERRAAVRRDNKGGGNEYYVCAAAKTGQECPLGYKAVRAGLVDAAVLAKLPDILRECPAGEGAAGELGNTAAGLSLTLEAVEEDLWMLLDGRDAARLSPIIRSRVDALEVKRAELRAELREVTEKLGQMGPEMVQRRAAKLADAMTDGTADIQMVNAGCRALFKSAQVDPVHGLLVLEWRHGGDVILPFDAAAAFGKPSE